MARVAEKPVGEIVIALDSAALTAPDGGEYLIHAGQRFRTSDLVYEMWPHLFAPADSSDGELEAARRAISER